MNSDWPPSLQKRVRSLLLRGLTHRQIRERTGLSFNGLREGIYRHGLNTVPANLVPLADLWRPLAFADVEAFTHHVKRRGLPVRHVGARCPCLPREVAQQLLDEQEREPAYRTRPPGKVTVPELMTRWRMAKSAVQDHLEGLPRCRLRGVCHGGIVYLYDERDVARVAPPVAPRGAPRGYVGTAELARLTGRTSEAVRYWAKRGCPHIRDRDGRLCFRLEDVAAWCGAQKDPRVSRTGRWLARQLAEQGKVAA